MILTITQVYIRKEVLTVIGSQVVQDIIYQQQDLEPVSVVNKQPAQLLQL